MKSISCPLKIFKMLLGGRFDGFDKPYFAQIDDYVIFSDSPNTLKGIIDKVLEEETLSTSETFRDFDRKIRFRIYSVCV